MRWLMVWILENLRWRGKNIHGQITWRHQLLRNLTVSLWPPVIVVQWLHVLHDQLVKLTLESSKVSNLHTIGANKPCLEAVSTPSLPLALLTPASSYPLAMIGVAAPWPSYSCTHRHSHHLPEPRPPRDPGHQGWSALWSPSPYSSPVTTPGRIVTSCFPGTMRDHRRGHKQELEALIQVVGVETDSVDWEREEEDEQCVNWNTKQWRTPYTRRRTLFTIL
jgi:hypothetical protein